MLNLLTITLLLAACIFCQVADPTADKVGSPVDLKTLYPIKHYHKMGSWSYITVDGVKYIQGTVPAGFYTFDVSLWLRNQYKLQNKKRAWYTHRCQAYKNATKQWSEDYLVTRDIESSDVEFFSSSGIHLGFYSEHMRHNTLKGIFVETECNRIFRAKYSTVYNQLFDKLVDRINNDETCQNRNKVENVVFPPEPCLTIEQATAFWEKEHPEGIKQEDGF